MVVSIDFGRRTIGSGLLGDTEQVESGFARTVTVLDHQGGQFGPGG